MHSGGDCAMFVAGCANIHHDHVRVPPIVHHSRSDTMADKIYKLLELVGTSNKSSDDAIQNAIASAADTVRNLDRFEVLEQRGSIQNGKVTCYQVTLKVGLRLDLPGVRVEDLSSGAAQLRRGWYWVVWMR